MLLFSQVGIFVSVSRLVGQLGGTWADLCHKALTASFFALLGAQLAFYLTSNAWRQRSGQQDVEVLLQEQPTQQEAVPALDVADGGLTTGGGRKQEQAELRANRGHSVAEVGGGGEVAQPLALPTLQQAFAAPAAPEASAYVLRCDPHHQMLPLSFEMVEAALSNKFAAVPKDPFNPTVTAVKQELQLLGAGSPVPPSPSPSASALQQKPYLRRRTLDVSLMGIPYLARKAVGVDSMQLQEETEVHGDCIWLLARSVSLSDFGSFLQWESYRRVPGRPAVTAYTSHIQLVGKSWFAKQGLKALSKDPAPLLAAHLAYLRSCGGKTG